MFFIALRSTASAATESARSPLRAPSAPHSPAMATRRQRFLSTPVTTKHSTDGEGEYLKFGTSAMQGWRQSMEDTLVASTSLAREAHHASAGGLHKKECPRSLAPAGVRARHDVAVFAVFDGHGGRGVADFCEKQFSTELWWDDAFRCGDLGRSLVGVFHRMDELLHEMSVIASEMSYAEVSTTVVEWTSSFDFDFD